MAATTIYPLRFRPVYKDYLWGGDRIIRAYHRDEPPGVYAESWEVSDRDDGMSFVANGHWSGRSLGDVVAELGEQLLGTGRTEGPFPLLIKLIDAQQRLSVQVHPNDDTAARFGGEAKTEMWYVLEADPGARVLAGLRPNVDEDALRTAIEEQAFEDILNTVPVSTGDAVFTPGGRVHAIDAGCLILEVQQNSNTTYRIYDWGRVSPDGAPRDLHIEEALRVVKWHDAENAKLQPRCLGHLGKNELWEIAKCPYFRLERLHISEEWPAASDGRSFQVLFVADGNAVLQYEGGREELAPGDTCLVPAALTAYELTPVGDAVTVLRVTAP